MFGAGIGRRRAERYDRLIEDNRTTQRDVSGPPGRKCRGKGKKGRKRQVAGLVSFRRCSYNRAYGPVRAGRAPARLPWRLWSSVRARTCAPRPLKQRPRPQDVGWFHDDLRIHVTSCVSSFFCKGVCFFVKGACFLLLLGLCFVLLLPVLFC